MACGDCDLQLMSVFDTLGQEHLYLQSCASLRPPDLRRTPNLYPRLAPRLRLVVHHHHAHEVRSLLSVGEALRVNRPILLDNTIRWRFIKLLVILDHHGLSLLAPLFSHLVHLLLSHLRTLEGELTGLVFVFASSDCLLGNGHHGLAFSHSSGLVELCSLVCFPHFLSLLPHLLFIHLLFLIGLSNFLLPIRIARISEFSLGKSSLGILKLLQTSQRLPLTKVCLGPGLVYCNGLYRILQSFLELFQLQKAGSSIGVQPHIFRCVIDRTSVKH
mmetsp:Transcript_96199/g.170403  ORF Transcript_96199/g.170403 Transcript_96199/m.170403 type:complete len:273 (-) Transcript_96199:372-1190(-)